VGCNKKEERAINVVDVPSKDEFDALTARVTALEQALATLQQPLPQDVKDALLKVLEWLKGTVE
jgi:hypothetical protein